MILSGPINSIVILGERRSQRDTGRVYFMRAEKMESLKHKALANNDWPKTVCGNVN